MQRHTRFSRTLTASLAALLAGVATGLHTPDKRRRVLEAAYAGPPSRFLEVSGLRLHVRDTGPRAAPAVILLHGLGGSLHTWDAWADDLDRDHRVVRFDLPGFGLTGADPTGDYTDRRAIEIVLALMDRLGVGWAVIVGHSMGGRIAWTLAALHPNRVGRLVLVSPDGFASPGYRYGVAPRIPPVMRALPYVLPTSMFRRSLATAYADHAVLTRSLFTRYRDMMLAPGVRRAILARMRTAALVEPTPLLARIACPTLLLWGERDRMIPFRNAADYRRALSDAIVVPLPDVGHIPQEEAPATVAAVRDFLDRRA